MATAEVEIPKKYKAAVYDKPGTVSTKIEELETPEPGAGEILINLTHSGVCHSDFGVMTNSWKILPAPTEAGQVGGHEGVGKVVKMGANTETSGVKIGDRVGIKWIASACGNCPACLVGSDGVCQNSKISGYYTPGTFQQYVLAPATYATPIPESLDSALAAPMLCAGVTVYAALKRSGAKSGDWVVIPGAGGGLGHIALQFGARGLGLRMIGIDSGDKEQLAKDCGAEVFFDITKFPKDDGGEAIAKEVKEATGGAGATAVVVCTASNAAYAQALDFLKFNGTLVCVGIPEGEHVAIPNAFPGKMVAGQLRIVGSAVGNRQEAIETLDFAARGLVKTTFRTEKMDKLTSIFEEMDAGKLRGRVVLDLS